MYRLHQVRLHMHVLHSFLHNILVTENILLLLLFYIIMFEFVIAGTATMTMADKEQQL